MLRNTGSDAHLLRIINRPTRGIGATSQTRLAERAATAGTSFWEALQDPAAAGLKTAASKRVKAFVTLIRDLQEEMKAMPLDELLARVVEATGYREMLVVDDTEEGKTRLENLQSCRAT